MLHHRWRARLSLVAFLILLVPTQVLLATGAPPASASTVGASAQRTCFPETSFCADNAFLEFWQRNGALPILGFPIDEPRRWPDGLIRQYYERVILEWHQENEAKYQVLLTRLGADASAGNPRTAEPPIACNSTNCNLFTETNHTLRGVFRDYWIANGGLPVFGFPLTEEFTEVSPTNGQTYTVQYFERNRFEYHPDITDPKFQVLLGQLARERFNREAATIRQQPAAQVPQYSARSGTVWLLDWGGPDADQIGSREPPPPYNCIPKVSPLVGPPKAKAVAWNFNILAEDGTVWSGDKQVPGLANIVSVGFNYAVRNDGTVWTLGQPSQVRGLTNVIAADGANMDVFLKRDGTVWSIDRTSGGRLFQVPGISGATAISSGGLGNALTHALALRSDGTVLAWQPYGTAEQGVRQVPGLTDVKAIASGEGMSLALKSDGTVWWWYAGGDSNASYSTWHYSQPRQVAGLNNVIAIAGNSVTGLAAKADGTLWTWWRSPSIGCPAGPLRVTGLPPVFAVGQGTKRSLVIAEP